MIHGAVIPISPQVKFLGVTYDCRLTWGPHITNVVDRTKKTFNLMRSVAGQSWGASKKALLTIYRALIRSRLDYGCEAYYTACNTQLQRLDTIQSKCLRLCCGAFRTTAVNALQQDCGEMPLHLRRKKLLLRFATKVAANLSNPASKLLQDHWKSNPVKYNKGKEPIYNFLQEYLVINKQQLQGEASPSSNDLDASKSASIAVAHTAWRLAAVILPWQQRPPSVDITLAQRISKKETSATLMKTEVLGLLEKYAGWTKIFTDASKLVDGGVAAAFYVENTKFANSQKMEDSTTIYS